MCLDGGFGGEIDRLNELNDPRKNHLNFRVISTLATSFEFQRAIKISAMIYSLKITPPNSSQTHSIVTESERQIIRLVAKPAQ